MHGANFESFEDFRCHMRSVIEDPWLHALVPGSTRKERRARRVAAPEPRPGAFVYNSDGASRSRDGGRLGSYGVVLQYDGVQLARVGVFLGDVTNNIAEYEGIAEAMRHALRIQGQGALHVVFRVDSMLVKRQVLCEIACRSSSLQPLHEPCMLMLRDLRRQNPNGKVEVEHVYREFNTNADGTANEALDSYVARLHADGVVVNESWHTSQAGQPPSAALGPGAGTRRS